jgi:hypothetical protein
MFVGARDEEAVNAVNVKKRAKAGYPWGSQGGIGGGLEVLEARGHDFS